MSIANKAYLLALGITLASELGIVWAAYRGRVQPAWRVPLVFLAVNLFTHGLLWTLWPRLPGRYAARVLLSEIAVWLVEAAAYRWLLGGSTRRALLASLAANLVSTLIGLAVWRWMYGQGGFELLR